MKLLTGFLSEKGLGIGTANGAYNGVNSTLLAQRTIQINTQNGIGSGYYGGGTYDNNSGALIWATLPSGGWGSGSLNVAIASAWGTYQTANPALMITQYSTIVYGQLQANTVAVPPGISLGAWDDGSSYGLLNPDNGPMALYNVDNGQYYFSPNITVDSWYSNIYLSGAVYVSGALAVTGALSASNMKSLSAFGTKSGSTGTLGGSGATVYYRNLTVDGVTVQVLCFT